MKHKFTALTAILAASALALSACSSGGTPGGGGTEGTGGGGGDEKVSIRLGTPDTGPGAEFFESVVARYNESQDKIEVKVESYGGAFDQKITAQIGAGNAPDIMKMWNFPQYHGALLPINDFVDAMPDKDDFYGTLFNYATIDGNLYGFPTGFSTRAVYYNKTLADQAGLTASDTWSNDDYKMWVEKIGALGGGVYGGNQMTNVDGYAMESILFNNGGEWLDDSGAPVANSAENKEVINFLHDLAYGVDADFVRKHPVSEDSSKIFIANQLGTFEFGKWYTDAFNEAGVDYGIVPMYTFDGLPPRSVVHAAFLSINKDSKNVDAAKEFLAWYALPENVKEAAAYDLPIRQSVADELGLTEDPINKPFFEVLSNSEELTSSMLKAGSDWPEVSDSINKSLEKIFSNAEIDVDAELDRLQAELESLN